MCRVFFSGSLAVALLSRARSTASLPRALAARTMPGRGTSVNALPCLPGSSTRGGCAPVNGAAGLDEQEELGEHATFRSLSCGNGDGSAPISVHSDHGVRRGGSTRVSVARSGGGRGSAPSVADEAARLLTRAAAQCVREVEALDGCTAAGAALVASVHDRPPARSQCHTATSGVRGPADARYREAQLRTPNGSTGQGQLPTDQILDPTVRRNPADGRILSSPSGTVFRCTLRGIHKTKRRPCISALARFRHSALSSSPSAARPVFRCNQLLDVQFQYLLIRLKLLHNTFLCFYIG